MQHLTAETEDLAGTVDTLKSELVLSNAEAERLSRELAALRTRALTHDTHEAHARERALHEAHAELERSRLECDEWAHSAEQERVLKEEAREIADAARRELDLERDARMALERELGTDKEKAANLQSVLEDFQAGMVPARLLGFGAELYA